MTDKQRNAISTILSAIPEDIRSFFGDAADHAMSLGYMPVLKGAKKTYVDFIKNKTGKIIMKIDIDPKFPPRLALQFFALRVYSGIFKQAVDERVQLLRDMGYEAGCYGCGKCDGTVGYAYDRPDGKPGFMCGRGVVTLPSFTAANVAEVNDAMTVQDKFFTDAI